ncbi:hypothetical protein CFC21_089337, partial [Triticum aestivum]
D